MEQIGVLNPAIEIEASNQISRKAWIDLVGNDDPDVACHITALEVGASVEDEVPTSEAILAQFRREERVEEYCDAVVTWDVKVISAVLEEASKDEVLDRMIADASHRLRSWESGFMEDTSRKKPVDETTKEHEEARRDGGRSRILTPTSTLRA